MSGPGKDWSARRPLTLGFFTVAVLVGGLGAWSVFTTLAGAIVAPGQIEVSQSRQVVQHPDGGVVEEIMVREGDKVAAGDILLRLDGSALRSELAIVENQLLELGARRARLAAQSGEAMGVAFPAPLLAAAQEWADVAEIVAGQDSLFRKQVEALAQARDQRQTRIRQIDSQITGLIAQEEAIATQMRLLADELVIQRDLLARGLSQAPRVSALERELAQLKGQAGGLTSARAEAAGRITEIEIEITALVTQSRETAEVELRDVVARERELQERQGALQDRIDRLDVRAPASGLVLGLTVTTPQSVIRTADALLFVVPQDRPLLVAARVPVTHVDEVRPGQEVRLVFSSLPASLTPELVGQVTLISADALADERTGHSYFRAEIALEAEMLARLGGVQVVPGMPVDAFIQTGERTPLSYLLKPFTDYFRGAFRET